jgi:uncharacterized membrane protein
MRKRKDQPWSGLEIGLFAAFLFWCAAGLFFSMRGVTPATLAGWPMPEELRNFVALCLRYGDAVLILLAFANTHLQAARQWTPAVARRWGAFILVASFGIETMGAATGLPFGSYHYTDRFGPILGIVPVTIPLAWHVVVTNALFLVRMLVPNCSRLAEAALAGFIATVYDFILEPFATQLKGYWLWTDGSVPPLNYLAWFVLTALLVRLLAPTVSNRYRWDIRPAAILGLTILIFITARTPS